VLILSAHLPYWFGSFCKITAHCLGKAESVCRTE
jgi:hypothetical protein